MSDRFYAEAPIRSDTVQVGGSEAHHLLHVMRAKIGTEVTLFDGTGFEYSARIVRTGRQQVELEILSRSQTDRELKRKLVLGVALPKGDRQTWLVEKAVELGVQQLVPLYAARSVVRPTSSTLKKLRRAVIEASKQCGRNRLMQIADAQPLEEYSRQLPSDAVGWLAHPDPLGQPNTESGAPLSSLSTQRSLYIAIGPEGGFSDDELRLAAHAGWIPVCLGARILRVETAAVALVSIVMGNDEMEAAEPFDGK